MGAVVAESPGFNFGYSHVHLVDFYLSAFGVKCIGRSKFRKSAYRRAFILIIPGVIRAFPFLNSQFFSVNQGMEHNPGFRKSIVWEQSFIREEIKGVAVADVFYQRLKRGFFNI